MVVKAEGPDLGDAHPIFSATARIEPVCDQNAIRRNAHGAYPYPPQLVTSTPSALIPAMMRSGTTRAGGQS